MSQDNRFNIRPEMYWGLPDIQLKILILEFGPDIRLEMYWFGPESRPVIYWVLQDIRREMYELDNRPEMY